MYFTPRAPGVIRPIRQKVSRLLRSMRATISRSCSRTTSIMPTPHVERAEHVVLRDVAVFGDKLENRRYRPTSQPGVGPAPSGPELRGGFSSPPPPVMWTMPLSRPVRRRADGPFDASACEQQRDQVVVAAMWREQLFTRRPAEVWYALIEPETAFFQHPIARQGIPVGVKSGGRKPQHHVSGADLVAVDDLLPSNPANDATGEVILLVGVLSAAFPRFLRPPARNRFRGKLERLRKRSRLRPQD